jgi:hypothetical protein
MGPFQVFCAQNREFWGGPRLLFAPQMALTYRLDAIYRAQKLSISRAQTQTYLRISLCISTHQKHYAQGCVNHWCITRSNNTCIHAVSPTSPMMSRLVLDIPFCWLCSYYAFNRRLNKKTWMRGSTGPNDESDTDGQPNHSIYQSGFSK